MKISATIITFNEEHNIQAACESVSWADELIVVDSNSTDTTSELAAECGATVISREWPGFSAQKQFATDQATNEWIFSLDADERVSDQLKESIQRLRDRPASDLAEGYLVSRRTFYQGRWIRGGGWYPDRQLRLFKKSHGYWSPRHIHESVKMDSASRIEGLAGDLLHFTSSNAAHHHRMIGERYAPLGARQMFEDGRRTSSLRIATAGPAAFLRSYLLKFGFRDGLAGLTIARFAAHNAFLKHLMLWEMQRKKIN
ncbi:MAG TPA: glycosyltransferase family 2 protein [Pyrinomonadaceae bacterium]